MTTSKININPYSKFTFVLFAQKAFCQKYNKTSPLPYAPRYSPPPTYNNPKTDFKNSPPRPPARHRSHLPRRWYLRKAAPPWAERVSVSRPREPTPFPRRLSSPPANSSPAPRSSRPPPRSTSPGRRGGRMWEPTLCCAGVGGGGWGKGGGWGGQVMWGGEGKGKGEGGAFARME